jgi:PPOX class probable F420-dependent enzyme
MSVNRKATVPLGRSGIVAKLAALALRLTSVHHSTRAMKLTEEQREFLQNPFVGTITDLRPDGSPHTTVVWVDADDDGVSFNTAYGRAKPRYIALDPRVSLTVVDPVNAYRWLSVSGRATLVDEGADEQIDRLAQKYLGKDSYPFRAPDERRVTVRITPTRIEGRDLD